MLSIIIIEYHSIKEIDEFACCLNTYLRNDYELIISSNSLYPIEEQKSIVEQLPAAHWLFNETNGGFAYGMNEGMKVANGDVLLIMNPDVRLKSSLEPMINYLLEHQDVGIIAPKIVDINGTIQDSFRSYVTPWGFILRHINRIINRGSLHVANLKKPISVDWIIGAFMMCRRDFYEKVGGLSNDYFLYCEDMDWCKRANLAGYNVVYFPETIIQYKGTRSARRSWKYAKIFINSLFIYWRKYIFK